MPPPADLSALLLRLYALARERPLAQFQDAALALLQRQALPFDSAMWGAGVQTAQGFDMQIVHLHAQPPEMLEAYQAICHLDTAAAAVTHSPRAAHGFHVPSWFNRPEQAALRDYGRCFEQANFFISADGDPATGAFQWMTLIRADDSALCRDSECALLELLTPHLMQALALNRMLHPVPASPDGAAAYGQAQAICSLRGLYCQRDALFQELLRQEWSGPPRAALPMPVLHSLSRGDGRYTGRHIVIAGQVDHGLLFLRARLRCPADALGQRERAVARHVAQGLTHKEIAHLLGSAPATVRNQMQAIHRKLGTRNAVELAAQLRQAW